MAAKLRCIVIDDEPFALNILAEDIMRIPLLELVDKFTNPLATVELIQRGAVDLIFLDIQMPTLLGTQFLRALAKPPMVIFTTAYAQYAVESYELNVVDYLLKPIRFERLLQASTKASDRFHQTASTQGEIAADTYFFVHCEHKEVKIYHHDVLYIEGLKDYVKIFVASRPGKPILTRLNMKAMENRLHNNQFCRVHQSFIIPINRITAFQKTRILLGTTEIPVGGRYANGFLTLYRQS